MNTNITQEIKDQTGYGMIEGRATIHSMSCSYIKNTKRNVIRVDKATVDSSDCLCEKCLKSTSSKWTADIEENGYSVVLDLMQITGNLQLMLCGKKTGQKNLRTNNILVALQPFYKTAAFV